MKAIDEVAAIPLGVSSGEAGKPDGGELAGDGADAALARRAPRLLPG